MCWFSLISLHFVMVFYDVLLLIPLPLLQKTGRNGFAVYGFLGICFGLIHRQSLWGRWLIPACAPFAILVLLTSMH